VSGTPDQSQVANHNWTMAAFRLLQAPAADDEWILSINGKATTAVSATTVADLTRLLANRISSDFLPVVSGSTVTLTGSPPADKPAAKGSEYFYAPVNPNTRVDETQQVDTMVVWHGNSPADDKGTLTATTLTGLGMADQTTINGRTLPGGITYGGLEVVDL